MVDEIIFESNHCIMKMNLEYCLSIVIFELVSIVKPLVPHDKSSILQNEYIT